jgi:two-component system, sensor histidine kinase LadS
VGVCGKPDFKQVFTKYYRSATVMNFSGSGLGLYLVDTLVRLVNGDVQYIDEGDWISFQLSLPKATFA